jgi:hypothetical protein
MAREEKPIRLRPVDGPDMEPPPVVRLQNPETGWKKLEVESQPVRLVLPEREEVELRTHQPGIDVIANPDRPKPELLEENWGESPAQHQPIAWGWFALIGLVMICAMLWSLRRMEKADTQAVRIRSETHSVIVDEEREQREAAQLVDRIDKTVRDFVNASSVEALSHLSRQRARVLPLMRRYYSDKPVFSGSLKVVKMLQPVTLDNRGNFWLASIVRGEGEVKNLVVEIEASGEPRIDWETYVCYQPMKWDEFATKRPTGTSVDFRVYAERDNFHSHEFSDADQWLCFRLTALGSEETLFGYARAGSPEAKELLNQFETNGGGRISLILRLKIPENLQSRHGVVIEKLLCPRWMYVDPPDSGS